MLRADAVVLGGGEDERLGIGDPLAQILVGRRLLPEGPHRRILDAAIFAFPRGAGGDFRDADHVEQGDVDDDGVPQFGVLGELDPGLQAPVRAAADAEAARAGDLARNEVAADRGEIVIDDLALGPEPGLVPLGAELTAAADVGEGINPALFEPQLARGRGIARGLARVEPAIGIEQGRVVAGERHVAAVDEEIGDFGPVARHRLMLFGDEVRGVELGALAADFVRRAALRIGQPQRRRDEEAGHRQQRAVIAAVGVDDAERAVVGECHRRAGPALCRRGEAKHAPVDVVERGDQQAALGGRSLDHRLARAGGVDQRGLEMGGIGFQLGEVDRDERPGGEAARCRAPVLAGLDDHSAGDHVAEARLARDGEAARALGGQDPGLGVEGVERAVDHGEGTVLAVAQHIGGDAVAAVLWIATVQLDRGGQRLAALQPLDDIRIARAAKLARRPFAADEKAVLVFPGDSLLALGKHEAAVDKAAGGEVELAHRDRVLAAVGQAQQAAALSRAGALRALPYPVRLFRRGERVEVEDGRPLRVRRRVAGDARPPPDAADMIFILPEIIDLPVDEASRGKPVLGLRQRQRLGEIGGVARIGLELGGGLGVMRLDPRHGARRGEFLEPQIRVVARPLRHRRPRSEHRQSHHQPTDPAHELLPLMSAKLAQRGDPVKADRALDQCQPPFIEISIRARDDML